MVTGAADEGWHDAGPERLWNESWYFDFVDAAQGIGGWVRLGLVPNQQTAWVQALLCGPGSPTIVAKMRRLTDRMVLAETHAREAQALRSSLGEGTGRPDPLRRWTGPGRR